MFFARKEIKEELFKKVKKIPSNIIFFIGLTIIFPLVDSVNGFLLSSHINLPIGILYRSFYFLYLLVAIFSYGFPRKFYTFLTVQCLLGCFLIILFQNVVLQNPFSLLVSDLVTIIKFSLWLLIPYYIYQRREEFRNINYSDLFLFISLFLVLGLFIPYMLGMGHYTYENSNAGYKGFFFATNDITIAFMIATIFTGRAVTLSIVNKRKWTSLFLLLLYLGLLSSLLLISTKTGVVFGVIYTIVLLINFLFFEKKIQSIYRVFMVSLFAISIVYLIFVGKDFIIGAISGTYTRITYFYHLYDGNLIRLLTSSRSEYLKLGFQSFWDPNNPLSVLWIGFGFEYRLIHFGGAGVGGLMEMDFFDTLFGLGLIGTLLVSSVIGYFLILSLRRENYSIYTIALITILLYSFFAGHVLFSALCTTLLGLICGGIILTHTRNDQIGRRRM
ncbi:O-antigen ligase family protein [Listeria kieliensis]